MTSNQYDALIIGHDYNGLIGGPISHLDKER